jgi:hypothetical protein
MTPPRETQKAEVLGNYEVFKAALPDLIRDHAGRYAAYRHGELVQIFDSFREALAYCADAFSDRIFSIQEITAEAIDLGWFAHASGGYDGVGR